MENQIETDIKPQNRYECKNCATFININYDDDPINIKCCKNPDLQLIYYEELDAIRLDQEKIKFGLCYEEIIEILKNYIDMQEDYYSLVAVWIMGTYFYESFDCYPYIFINAMKGSGKSRLLRLMACLSNDGDKLSSLTEAVLFRSQGTLCIDEFERIGSKEKSSLRELLNLAYKKGSKVKRMRKSITKEGEKQVIEEFSVYRPIAIANIWGMEEVLSDRCLTLILEKSNDLSKIMKMEDFENNLAINNLKLKLNELKCRLCHVVTQKQCIENWNNYINYVYNSNDITTYTTLRTETTQTTPTTILSNDITTYTTLMTQNDTNDINNINNNIEDNNNLAPFGSKIEEVEDIIKEIYSDIEVEFDKERERREEYKLFKKNSNLDISYNELEFFNKLNSSKINGRNLELVFPLLQISKFLCEEELDRLLLIAKNIINIKKDDEFTESRDVNFIEFLSINSFYDFIPILELTKRFKEFLGEQEEEDKWINSKWTGRALKRLNLISQKRRLSKGREVVININKAREKIKIFKPEILQEIK